MNIYLMRHFKVDFEWKKKYTSRGFKIAAEAYNSSNIIIQDVAFHHRDVQVYISELMRSHLTYKALGMDIEAQKTDLINEVPIAPFIDTDFKIPTPVWRVMGRVQWFLNIKRQPEIRRETLNRIETLINRLEKEKSDVLIIGHGFYFSQLKNVLKNRGYAGRGKSYYKNGEMVKFTKASG